MVMGVRRECIQLGESPTARKDWTAWLLNKSVRGGLKGRPRPTTTCPHSGATGKHTQREHTQEPPTTDSHHSPASYFAYIPTG